MWKKGSCPYCHHCPYRSVINISINHMNDIKIAVAGTGYVGLSIATLLSQHHKVTAVDVIPEKVELINQRKSPIQDEYIERYLAEKDLFRRN